MNVQLRAWLLDTRQRIASGERIQLSADQAQRAADRLIAAEKTGQEAVLLQGLTSGIQMALAPALNALGPGELPEVVEGEVVVEEMDEA